MSKSRKTLPPELVSLAEMARRKGVNRSTATRAAQGVLAPAMVDKECDASHPAACKWLGVADRAPTPPPRKGSSGDLPSRDDFVRLQYRKREAEAERLEIINRERRGELVSRELIETHVFGPIHAGFTQLLRDVTRTAAARVLPMARRNEPIQEIEKVIAEQITATLKPMIAEAVRKAKRLGRQKKDSSDANPSP